MSEKLEVSCDNCVGACCRGGAATYTFDKEEVDLLKWAGTDLVMFLPASPDHDWTDKSKVKKATADLDDRRQQKFTRKRAKEQIKAPEYGLYGFKPGTNCGFAVEDEAGALACGIHEFPEMMPRICKEFTAGSDSCRSIRSRFGVGMDTGEINLDLARIALGEEQLITFEADAQ